VRSTSTGGGAVAPTTPWWAGDGLSAGPAGLTIDGHPLADLAARHGTPLYVYSRARIRRQVGRLRAALATLGVPARAYYAVKANRHPDVLATIRAEGDLGVDCCSPREVELALAAGFGGLGFLLFARHLRRAPLVPVHDPMLAEERVEQLLEHA
jgi:hypothetical protein